MSEYESLKQAFANSNVDLWEMAVVPPRDIAKKVNRSALEIARFVSVYESAVTPLKVIEQPRIYSTGDSGIDRMLGGGLVGGSLTEIAGPSAAGKTCLAAMIALAATLTSMKSVYITSEDEQCVTRMHQILPRFTDASLKDVYFRKCRSERELAAIIQHLPTNISCLVIDSITFCEEVETYQLLRRVAADRNVAVVVTNQVYTKIQSPLIAGEYCNHQTYESQAKWFEGFDQNSKDSLDHSKLCPKLGYKWTSLLDQRLCLKRISANAPHSRRELSLVFSPWAKPGTVELDLTELGLNTQISIRELQ